VKRFLPELSYQLSYVNDKSSYYGSQLINRLNEVFNKIEDIDNIEDYLEIYKKYSYASYGIQTLFNRNKDSNHFKNLVETIVSLEDDYIPVFSGILIGIESAKNILIRIKVQLAELVWKLNLKQCNKLNIFLDKIDYSHISVEYKIIKSMLRNKLESETISNLISPHKVYHFTPGVWDFSLDTDYLIYNSKYSNCFKEELNAIMPSISPDKQMVVYMTKGKMLIDLSDGTNTLEGEFLPIQGFIVQEILNCGKVHKENMKSFIEYLGIKNYTKVLETLADIIELKDDNYVFKSSLPNVTFINFAERYFTEIYTLMEEKIKYECSLSMEEILSSNICSLTKKSKDYSLPKDELFTKLKETISVIKFENTDVEKVLESMIKRDYITETDGMLKYQVF
jgi:hypothetical protein